MTYAKRLLASVLIGTVILGGAVGCSTAGNGKEKNPADVTLGRITSIEGNTVQLALVMEEDTALEKPPGEEKLIPNGEGVPEELGGELLPSRYKETGDFITFNLDERTEVWMKKGAEEQETESTNLYTGDVIELKMDSSGNASSILILEAAPRSE